MTAFAVLPAKDPANFGDALLRVLMTSTTDSLVVLDAAGRILLFNAGSEKLFGYSSHEILGSNFKELVQLPELATQSGRQQLVGAHREVTALHKDKSSFLMCMSMNAGQMDGEGIFVAIMNDLTNHKLDHAVRQNEQRLQTMLDGVPDAIVTIDAKGRMESFSASASALFGYDAADVLGQPLTMLTPSPYQNDRDSQLALLRGKHKNNPVNGGRVVIGRKHDGSAFPVEISIGETFHGDKHLFVAFIRDITGRAGTEQRLTQLQAELLRVSRMDDMAHMTMTIAHEMNQPLAAIANYISAVKQTLSRKYPATGLMEDVHALIENASNQTKRAATIIKRVRDFVEKREKSRELADLGEVVQEALALTFVSTSAVGVSVNMSLDPSLPLVLMDRVQIQQVLFNLIRNSLEAMPLSGKRELTLTTEACSAYAEVMIGDCGPGLAGSIADQLFQPFVTSKNHGMGVGLTICRAIIEAHGGRIWLVRSGPTGTVFRFRLPMPAAGASQ